ncbi:MAG: hypothetical protein IPN69_00905 [Acidobacteria bacterium]|nr:hypothetical protein [Acidobacteriota bacterium]
MIRVLLSCLIAIILAVPVFFLLIPFESYFLETSFDVLTQIDQSQWIAQFRDVGIYCLLISLFFTFIWLIAGYFQYRITNWRSAGGRTLWWVLFGLLVFVVFIFGYFMNFATDDAGNYIAALFYGINAVFVYWLATVLQSPATLKFAPPGAKQLRKIRALRTLIS